MITQLINSTELNSTKSKTTTTTSNTTAPTTTRIFSTHARHDTAADTDQRQTKWSGKGRCNYDGFILHFVDRRQEHLVFHSFACHFRILWNSIAGELERLAQKESNQSYYNVLLKNLPSNSKIVWCELGWLLWLFAYHTVNSIHDLKGLRPICPRRLSRSESSFAPPHLSSLELHCVFSAVENSFQRERQFNFSLCRANISWLMTPLTKRCCASHASCRSWVRWLLW